MELREIVSLIESKLEEASESNGILRVDRILEKSVSITKLGAALAKAQGKVENALKDSMNPHFKSRYADLASVVAACKDSLAANGIAVIQIPSADGPKVSVKTVLLHESGEYVSGTLTMLSQQNTPQAIGSCITYARRYALAAFVGVAPDDDDGNEATKGKASYSQPQSKPSSSQPQRAEAVPELSKADSLIKAFNDIGVTINDVEDYVGRSLKEFGDDDYTAAKEFYKSCASGKTKVKGKKSDSNLDKLNQFTQGK